jgi:hypothetical protein
MLLLRFRESGLSFLSKGSIQILHSIFPPFLKEG